MSWVWAPWSQHAYRYLESMPVGTQRSLAYLSTLLTYIHRTAKQEEYHRVRFLAMAGLASGGQYLLDGNWTNAWSMTSLPEPPWDTWANVSASEAKKAVHFRLLDPRWVASLAARLREEEACSGDEGASSQRSPRRAKSSGPLGPGCSAFLLSLPTGRLGGGR